MAVMAAGVLKRTTVCQSACLASKPSLKILLAKCTTAVAAMANGTGKNSANTGIRMVPRPNPEKSVTPDVSSATAPIRISSMGESFYNRISLSNFDYNLRIKLRTQKNQTHD